MPKKTPPILLYPNRWVSAEDGATATLTYAPQVNPAPLTVSIPDQDPTLASLEIVITNETDAAIQVQTIDFLIPVGPSASLTPTTDGIQYTDSDPLTWALSGPESIITDGVATYTLGPAVGPWVALAPAASVVVQLYQIQTITIPSTTTITVKETLSNGDLGFAYFQVTTFPDSFYFNSLSIVVPNGSTYAPVAQVPLNTPVTLLWNASVMETTDFYIYQSTAAGAADPVQPDKIGEWESPPLTDDTVFTVKVVATVIGGAPLVATLSASVAVQNPTKILNQLTVNGTSTLTGLVNATAINASSLGTTGAISGASVSATGAVSGASVSATGTVSGSQGTFTNSNVTTLLTVQNETVNGTLVTSGPVQMLQSPATVTTNGSFTYQTDGFVIGSVGSTPDPYNVSGTMTIRYGSVTVYVYGGYNPNTNSFMAGSISVPVPANTQVSISTSSPSSPQPVFAASFVSVGKNS